MGLLRTLGAGQGYLKGGFLGFQKSGKTFTATRLAIGLRRFLKLKGPIAFFDTEGGAEYIAPMVKKETGTNLIGVPSRGFDDLVNTAKEAHAAGVSVLIADSMTHVWRELCAAYLKRINEVLRAKGKPQRTRMEFQDWNVLKPQWETWTNLYLNLPLHIIICGRAGYEWDWEENDEGKKELIKTGVRMKTEGEFGFEPSLLVEMERVQDLSPNAEKRIIHRATVIGDRFSAMDGATCDNPDFDFFLPFVKCLTPGAHAPVDVEIKSDAGVSDDGEARILKERRDRTIQLEKIQGELLRAWPGQTAKEKKARAAIIEEAFGTRSWTEVETLDSDALRKGFNVVRAKATHIAVTEALEGEEKESNEGGIN